MIPEYVKVQETFASIFSPNYLKIRNSEKKIGGWGYMPSSIWFEINKIHMLKVLYIDKMKFPYSL